MQQQHSLSQQQNQPLQSQTDCLIQNSSSYHQILQQESLNSSQDAQADDNDSNGSNVSPPPPPTTEPPEEVTSFSWRGNSESQSLRTKSLGTKKPTTIDGPKHPINSGNTLTLINNNITNSDVNNTNSNNNNNNAMHMVSLSRRIEMPPAFLFPENETPPADLISTRDENRVSYPLRYE